MGRGMRRLDDLLPGLLAVLAMALVLGPLSGREGQVGLGVLYGLAMATGVQGGLLLPQSGGRVSIAGGLLVAVLALHGPITAATSVAAAVCFLALVRERADLLAILAIRAAALGGALLFRLLALAAGAGLAPANREALALVASAVGTWLGGRALDAVFLARSRSEGFWRVYADILGESLWAVAYYLTGAGLVFLALPAAEPAAVAALALAQRWLGQLLNRVFQDRAVDELIQRIGLSRQAYPGRQERVLHYAYGIGSALGLPEEELRLLGYAAVLQDAAQPPSQPEVDLAPDPPAPALRGELARRAAAVAALAARIGPLAPVARILRYRYAWWDGTGVPPARGDAIPLAARVLAAANGLAWLLTPPPELEDPLAASRQPLPDPGAQVESARQWLRQQEGRRLDPEVVRAAQEVLRADDAAQRGSRERVARILRQLRSPGNGPVSGWMPGPLGRLLWPLRHRLTWLDRLSPEVLAVAELGQLLGTTTDPATAAEQVADAVAALTGGCVFLALRDPDGAALSVRAARGFQRLSLLGTRLPLDGGPVTRVLLSQHPLLVPDLAANPPGTLARAVAVAEGVRAAGYFPLVARGRTVGLLFVGQRSGDGFTPRQVSLLELVAGQAALAVDNGLLLAEARERMLRIDEMRRFLGTLIEQLPTGVVALDVEGRITLINQTAREMLQAGGYPALAVGDPFPDLESARPLRQALAGQSVGCVIWEPQPGRYIELRAVPLRDAEGQTRGALALGWDVTRVRQMEQEVQRVARLADLGKLAAGAAHEIRNPLTAIRGFAQLIHQEAEPGSPFREYAEILIREIDRIEGLVSDMLLLARPGDPARAPVSLPRLLDEVVQLLRPELEQAGVTVLRAYDPEPAVAWGDEERLRQVAINLVRNGVEAMAGRPDRRLVLSTGACGPEAWFAVRDHGVGIPPETRVSLFTPFFTTKERGTGLGLAICYAVVEAHGGRIEVESEPGAGSTFRVWLPAPPGQAG